MKLYKYIDTYLILDEEGSRREKLELISFDVIKETKCGYWIMVNYKRKFITKTNKSSKKRFAYTTKEEALNNFIKRKTRQLGFIKFQLNRIERALNFANNTDDIINNPKDSITIFEYSPYDYY